MELLDRIFALHHELSSAHQRVPVKVLAERLECSPSTIKRVVQRMRDYFGAPIHSSRQGYIYQQSDNARYELPGLWFSPAEIRALLTLQQLLDNIQPGLLTPMLEPLKNRIGKLLDLDGGESPTPTRHKAKTKAKPTPADAQLSLFDDPPPEPASPHLDHGGPQRTATAEAARRIHLYTQAARHQDPARLSSVTDALGHRQRLRIRYHGRERDHQTERDVSPQRLTHYRDNWYLEAWCHQAGDLRRFSLDRILSARKLDIPAKDIDPQQLAQQMDSAYGIFSGPGEHTAILVFTPERARWIADERWHPDQRGSHRPDGSYQLEIPYTDPRELLLDLMRYGADVEVLAPEELRQAITDRLQAALARYREKKPQ